MTALAPRFAGHVHDLAGLGPVGWAVVALAGLVTVWVIWRAVRLTLDPGEEDPGHIKRMILEDDPPAGAQGTPPPRYK